MQVMPKVTNYDDCQVVADEVLLEQTGPQVQTVEKIGAQDSEVVVQMPQPPVQEDVLLSMVGEKLQEIQEMRAVEKLAQFRDEEEDAEVRWASLEEAAELLKALAASPGPATPMEIAVWADMVCACHRHTEEFAVCIADELIAELRCAVQLAAEPPDGGCEQRAAQEEQVRQRESFKKKNKRRGR